jgi:predicted dehydrogenase
MKTAIRWGILGTGGIAHLFVSDLLAHGHTVVAVGSRTDESARAFADRHGIPTAHGSYAELATDDNVDIIYVATPHSMHHDNALLALHAGKHVLVEKPFTLNAQQAQEIVDAAAERGLVALEAMWTRWLPHIVRLREIIAEGVIGEVRTVIADHNQNLPKDPTHRLNNPELGGGALLDLGIYPVSFAWDLLGVPSSIHAISSPTVTGVDRQTAIVFGYENGAQAVLHTALDTTGPTTASVLGTDGWIKLENAFYAPTQLTVYDSAGVVIDVFDGTVPGRGMQFQAIEAERLISEGLTESEILPASETVAIMKTLDTIRSQIGLRFPSE